MGLKSSIKLNMEVVEEGSEPAEFEQALGPLDKKAYDCMLQGRVCRGWPRSKLAESKQ